MYHLFYNDKMLNMNNQSKTTFLKHMQFLVLHQTILSIISVIEINAQEITFHQKDGVYSEALELNSKANGYKGIWYMNQPSNDEYVYKYSGGLATYTAKHRPFAIYTKAVDKTFFCFGGTDSKNSTLFHNISYYDHKTGSVANPTIIIDKKTTDAHDNPVLTVDGDGYLWIFSTSHGITRPSYIYKSLNPYNIDKFEEIKATEMVDDKKQPFNNFSYFQVYYVGGKGFFAFFTKYEINTGNRVIGFNTSSDGETWNEWQIIAHIDEGHYGISAEYKGRISIAFNYHPRGKGLNHRTNLYYMTTSDFGGTWHSVTNEKIELPATEINNPALVKNFRSEGLNCYLKDISHDESGNPVVLVVSSKGYQSGPANNPRTWEIFYFDDSWNQNSVTTSDNNYDMGSLYIEPNGIWRIIGPSGPGPQEYNPGGEIEMWVSLDNGKNWKKSRNLTSNSSRNHTYVRRPINAQPDFYGFWADGHGRKPSISQLYYCNKDGNVFLLPVDMNKKEDRAQSVNISK
jgi:hypothetical protein